MAQDINLGKYRVRPCGDFSPTKSYEYLDLVSYEGGSYICINYDTIDGTACIGVLPEGSQNSEEYWQCIAEKGDPGLLEAEYLPIGQLDDVGVWDFSITDKVYIAADFTKTLTISNVREGDCGAILTRNRDLKLPVNSDYAADFYCMGITNSNQYYMYTFIYANMGAGNRFIWKRSVINIT